jgi:hypothetical protein
VVVVQTYLRSGADFLRQDMLIFDLVYFKEVPLAQNDSCTVDSARMCYMCEEAKSFAQMVPRRGGGPEDRRCLRFEESELD